MTTLSFPSITTLSFPSVTTLSFPSSFIGNPLL